MAIKKLKHITVICKELYEEKGATAVYGYVRDFLIRQPTTAIAYQDCTPCEANTPQYHGVCLICGTEANPVLKTVIVCDDCGGTNVQSKSWVRPNQGNEFVELMTEDIQDNFCDDCNCNVTTSNSQVDALTPVSAEDFVRIAEKDIGLDGIYGVQLNTVGELRSAMSELDDDDQITLVAIDLETGDEQDHYPMHLDVIDNIRLTTGQVINEVQFVQERNAPVDTRPKQPVVDALIDVLADDIAKGDTTVLDELLLRMPFDVLKYCLPEDMWADFEDRE
jgi:hypothetical protein